MALNLQPVTVLPTPPQKTDPANFAARADPFLTALAAFGPEFNAVLDELNKIISGLDQAMPIAAYDSGATYNFPDVVAGSDGASYRCVDTMVVDVDPVAGDSSKWVNLAGKQGGGAPVGSIVPYVPGYFANSSNGGFFDVLGNNITAANTLLNPDGWYVCNGVAPNHPDSPIYNTPTRYLPNLTDDVFLMGALAAGAIGGSNHMYHDHVTDILAFWSEYITLTTGVIPPHVHPIPVFTSGGTDWIMGGNDAGAVDKNTGNNTGGGGAVRVLCNPPATRSGAASYSENRPSHLACLFIKRIF